MPSDPPEQACITAGPLLLCFRYLITSLGLEVIRDAPFDFWGGGLDYYFQLCFFFLKN